MTTHPSPTITSVVGRMRMLAAMDRAAIRRFVILLDDDDDRDTVLHAYWAAQAWKESGHQRFALTDELAALFRLTTAPRFGVESLPMPHAAFLVELPGAYLRLEDERGRAAPTAWIAVSRVVTQAGPGVVVLPMANGHVMPLGHACFVEGVTKTVDVESGEWLLTSERHADMRAACRIALNLIAYLGEHRPAPGTPSRGRTTTVETLRPPRDIVVTRELRAAAAACAAAHDLAGVRRAMAHHVRGHWRNQPCGEGRVDRRLTWIHPHRRGAESLGRVVERITKVTAK